MKSACHELGLCALALALFGFEATARASSDPAIPPECGSRADFDRQLRQRLGDDAPIGSVRVQITRGVERSHLRVELGSQLRELDDTSCSELLRAAVVIAVAMLGGERPAPPTPAPAPRSSAPASRLYPRLGVDAGAGLALGTLPQPVLALELEGKALWRSFGIASSLRYLTPTDKTTPEGKGVRLQALGISASGIFRPSRLWEARLGFAAQRLAGSGTGPITERGRDVAWAAGPTLGLAFVPLQLGSFWAGAGAEGQLNAVRGRFQILHYYRPVSEDAYVVYQVPWLAGAAFVRLGMVW